MITVGSLFSGIGGLELGLERAGAFKTIWFSEIDAYASAVLKKHWPDVPNIGDITKVDWDAVERPEMLAGGFPCQDVSVAGKGKGVREGARSGLWREYAKAIRIFRPRYALIENVPELANRGLDIVLADLAEMGYDAEWFVLSAAEVGAWHRRQRIFVFAHADGASTEYEIRTRGPQPSKCRPIPDAKGQREIPIQQPRQRGGVEQVCQNVSNAAGVGCQWRGPARDGRPGFEDGDSFSNPERIRLQESREYVKSLHQAAHRIRKANRADNGGWWATEPALGRVANGVPHRLDRIKCLGNAVVPQVAEAIGQMIMERERLCPGTVGT